MMNPEMLFYVFSCSLNLAKYLTIKILNQYQSKNTYI